MSEPMILRAMIREVGEARAFRTEPTWVEVWARLEVEGDGALEDVERLGRLLGRHLRITVEEVPGEPGPEIQQL
jgi:hypothetical protein